jgi:hypothetical protein
VVCHRENKNIVHVVAPSMNFFAAPSSSDKVWTRDKIKLISL